MERLGWKIGIVGWGEGEGDKGKVERSMGIQNIELLAFLR